MKDAPFPTGGNSPYYKALVAWAYAMEEKVQGLQQEVDQLRGEKPSSNIPTEPETFGFDNGE